MVEGKGGCSTVSTEEEDLQPAADPSAQEQKKTTHSDWVDAFVAQLLVVLR